MQGEVGEVVALPIRTSDNLKRWAAASADLSCPACCVNLRWHYANPRTTASIPVKPLLDKTTGPGPVILKNCFRPSRVTQNLEALDVCQR